MRTFPEADIEKTQEVIPEHLRPRETCGNQPSRPMTSAEVLAQMFSYHAPTEVTIPKFAAINQAAKNFAEVVLQNCPGGPDRVAAIEKIREARMTANAAISLNGLALW